MFSRLLLTVIFFLLALPVAAVTVSISDVPSRVTTDPFSVTVSIVGANPGTNYLRVDLFKNGSTQYFGETNNGSEWYSGSVGTSYYPLLVNSSESTASATFQARFGAPTLTEYTGPGEYQLRIRRYTSASSYSPSEPIVLTIDVPVATFTPTYSATPTKTPTTIPATQTATPTRVVTKTPTNTPISDSENAQEAPLDTPVATPDKVADTPSGTSTMGVQKIATGHMEPVIISLLLVGSGFGLLSVVYIWKIRKN